MLNRSNTSRLRMLKEVKGYISRLKFFGVGALLITLSKLLSVLSSPNFNGRCISFDIDALIVVG